MAGSTRSGSRKPTSAARPRSTQLCVRAGEDALVDVGITDMHPELATLLGQLRYRTSYGQNVLKHLVESAHIAGMMASELGLDPALLKRCTRAARHRQGADPRGRGQPRADRRRDRPQVRRAGGRGACDRGAPQRGRGTNGRGRAHPGRRRDQRRAPGRAAGVARGVRQAAGTAGGDRHRPRRRGEGLRDAGRPGDPGHGQAGPGRRHPGTGDRPGRGQAGRGRADLPRARSGSRWSGSRALPSSPGRRLARTGMPGSGR